MEKLVLEESTNTHVFESKKAEVLHEAGAVKLVKTETGEVVHGEHGTMTVNGPYFLKANQRELNPVTKQMQIAFD
jgi:non-ribosomal peptide synthetase component E (peptide arylation enzyme)